jgi:hypothetical protein
LVEVFYVSGRQTWGTQITSNENWFGKIRINQKQKYEKQIDKNNWIKKWIVVYYRRYLKY